MLKALLLILRQFPKSGFVRADVISFLMFAVFGSVLTFGIWHNTGSWTTGLAFGAPFFAIGLVLAASAYYAARGDYADDPWTRI